MTEDKNEKDMIINEDHVSLLNQLLAGEDPAEVAKKGNMTVQELIALKDYLLEYFSQQEDLLKAQTKRAGRNDPCPCGSGKKYKKCCMDKETDDFSSSIEQIDIEEKLKAEREREVAQSVQQGFTLLGEGLYVQLLELCKQILKKHPHEDRLYDLQQLAYLYTNMPEAAEKICRSRWLLALKDFEFIKEHGYQPRERDAIAPASAGFPPTAWLSKYFIAKRAAAFKKALPQPQSPEMRKLIAELKSADDMVKFPEKQQEGLTVRFEKLKPVIEKLQAHGKASIPYLMPLATRYSWTCLLVPAVLAGIDDDEAKRGLIDITMFQIAYASESSMRYLQGYGKSIIPLIKQTLARNNEFDPIKSGIISVLAKIKDEQSFNQLIALLDHDDARVVNWVAGALAEYGDPRALPKMIAARNRIGSEPKLDWGIDQLQMKTQMN